MKILHHNMEAKGREYMRLFNIIELAKQYMFLGLIFVLLMGMISAAGYFVVYKKIMKGKKQIRLQNMLWAGTFLCYLVVLLCATVLDRSSVRSGSKIMPLFYSYREAWYSFSVAEWRNIVLNIVLLYLWDFCFRWEYEACDVSGRLIWQGWS